MYSDYSDQIKISLIVPVLNESENILRLLDSIDKQKTLPDELIFVDGYSTDLTLMLIKTHQVTEKLFTKIIRRKPHTIADARQVGALSASGNILVFTDGDSYFLSEEFFENIKRQYIHGNNQHDFLYGQVVFYDNNNSTYMKFLNKMYLIILHLLRAVRIPLVFGSCMAVSTNRFYSVCGFNTELAYGEDNDIALRCGCNNVKYIPDMKVGTSGRRFNTVPKLLRHCYMVLRYVFWKLTDFEMPVKYVRK